MTNRFTDQAWEEFNTMPDKDPRKCVWLGAGKTLCGEQQPLYGLSLTSWSNRHQAECSECQILVAICEANDIGPHSEPSIRAALEKFLKESRA